MYRWFLKIKEIIKQTETNLYIAQSLPMGSLQLEA